MSDPPDSPESEGTFARAHPLARLLAERMQERRGARVLDYAAGRGRNGVALRRAGFEVVAVDDARAQSEAPFAGVAGPFAAALTTHGMLHGRRGAVEARLDAIAGMLEDGGLLYATFGSSRDARFGQGDRLDAWTYAPLEGDERGVAHTCFDRAEIEALLRGCFAVESLDEHAVDDIAGSWAHTERPLAGAVHWFAIARKRSTLSS